VDIKGVCYDTGRAYGGGFVTRRVFDPVMTRRELQIIRGDLHCNAVRFQGTDIGRLMTAATDALKLGGLQVWLSPELFKKSREATLAHLVRAAAAAKPLRGEFPGRLVFCVGTESSLFTNGIVPGRTVNQRHPLRSRTPRVILADDAQMSRARDGAAAGHGAGAPGGALRSGIIREDTGLRERCMHHRPPNSPISPNPPR
jgi:hypothetical protein